MKQIYILLLLVFCIAVNAEAQTWQVTLNGRSVWSLAKDNSGNIYAGGLTNANSRIWRSTNQGASWDTIYSGSGQTFWGFAFDETGNIYVANFASGMLKSTNGGASFTVLDTSNFNGKRPQGIAYGGGGRIYITTASGFFRSTNYGATFTETALTGSNCLPVLADKDSANIVYVGVTSAAGVGVGFYRSTDYGLTFSSNLAPGLNGYNFMQKSDGTLYMITTTTPYPFRTSTNKGLTWTNGGNFSGAMRGIDVDANGRIYTAGNGGVWRSTNGGASFVNFGITGSSTPILVSGNKIYAGVTGDGIHILTDSTIVSTGSNNSIVSGFELNQNYPNPFNPVTNISFSIPKAGKVKLLVSDMLGRTAAVLFDKVMPSGVHRVTYNAEGLKSGVYFYKIEYGGTEKVRKMILLK